MSWFAERSATNAVDTSSRAADLQEEAEREQQALRAASARAAEQEERAVRCVASRGSCTITAHASEDDAVEATATVQFQRHKLELSFLMEEEEIAPMFDGAAWAGTLVWDAALAMIDYVERELGQAVLRDRRVLELGCGSGLPGMCCRLMGARVLLTEQPELVRLLRQNIDANAAALRGANGAGGTPAEGEREAARQLRARASQLRARLAPGGGAGGAKSGGAKSGGVFARMVAPSSARLDGVCAEMVRQLRAAPDPSEGTGGLAALAAALDSAGAQLEGETAALQWLNDG
eukprot:g2600.t1